MNKAHICKANGCTLPAQVVTDLNDKRQPKWGLCEHHHGKPSQQWGCITQAIKSNAARQQAIDIVGAITELSHTPYAPMQGESLQHWSERLSSSVHDDIHSNSNKQSNQLHMKQIKQTLSQGLKVSA